MNKVIILVVVISLWFTYQKRSSEQTEEYVPYEESIEIEEYVPYEEPTISKPIVKAYIKPIKQYRCDGRQHCSQMNSCEEARFFLRNCPNTKMDGDHDGVPCERKCRH